MEASLKKNNDIIVLELKGNSDFESMISLNATCSQYFNNKKVIFNLADLHFVGSSGLSTFVDILKKLNKAASLKICHCGTEFQRLLAGNQLDIYEDEVSAMQSFFKKQHDEGSKDD